MKEGKKPQVCVSVSVCMLSSPSFRCFSFNLLIVHISLSSFRLYSHYSVTRGGFIYFPLVGVPLVILLCLAQVDVLYSFNSLIPLVSIVVLSSVRGLCF